MDLSSASPKVHSMSVKQRCGTQFLGLGSAGKQVGALDDTPTPSILSPNQHNSTYRKGGCGHISYLKIPSRSADGAKEMALQRVTLNLDTSSFLPRSGSVSGQRGV